MYRKGHMPHNKGDDRVEMHYRNKRKMGERPIDSWQGSNPFKLNIRMSDLAMTRNSVRNSTVELF